MYVYIESEHDSDHSLYTVGFYQPNGEFMPESDWSTTEEAAERVHYLNGGEEEKSVLRPDTIFASK